MSNISSHLDPLLMAQLDRMRLAARTRFVEGFTSGQHKSPLRGVSVEFKQHRPYIGGDDLRRIDWRVTGRTDRPTVRENHLETSFRGVLAIDTSGSMQFRGQDAEVSKLVYARKIVAALAYILLSRGESIGFCGGADLRRRWLAPATHPRQLAKICEMLDQADCGGAGGVSELLRDLSLRLTRRGLVIVLSDFFEPSIPLSAAISRLAQRRHDLILLQIIDPEEIDFPFRGTIELRGLEDQNSIRLNGALMSSRYQARFKQHQLELAALCNRQRVRLLRFSTTTPVDQLLIHLLNPRGIE